MKSIVFACVIGLFSAVAPHQLQAAPPTKDIVFATVDSHELKLDLYLPEKTEHPPLVVFIHGGGWRNGSYKRCSTNWLTDYGFAVASIGYRLSDKAKFPAQVHDCKVAIRWLRAHADEYGYNAERVGVAGTSAGGYLALMLGVTGDHEKLEGDVGGNTDQSSRVQAVVDYFGPSDFVLRSQNQPVKTEGPDSPVYLLLGEAAGKNEKLARFASPAFHVSKDDAPLLIVHGENDKTVFLDQSERMVDEYRKAALDVTMFTVPDAGHGGKAHFAPEYREKVAAFLKKHLQPETNKATSAKEPELRSELLRRMKSDQQPRRAMVAFINKFGSGGDVKPETLSAEQQAEFAKIAARGQQVDEENTKWLKNVIATHGWPTISLVDKDGAQAAWLLVQHADADPEFQRQCLDLMNELPQHEVSQTNLAFLTDRVLLSEGKKQLYGTQFRFVDGELTPRPIEDEANVDKRRAGMGLPPLSEYIQQAERQFGESRQK